MSGVTFECECCGAFHSYSEVAEAGGYCPQCDADYDERKMFAKLASDYDQLKETKERLEAGIPRLQESHYQLRKRLDEARELLELARCGVSYADVTTIDAWLAANPA